MAMTFGIHIGHMGGPLDEMRRLWRFADEMGFDWFSVSSRSVRDRYDWDALHAFAEQVLPAFGVKRP